LELFAFLDVRQSTCIALDIARATSLVPRLFQWIQKSSSKGESQTMCAVLYGVAILAIFATIMTLLEKLAKLDLHTTLIGFDIGGLGGLIRLGPG
jgi:hypothetical protein